MAYIKLCQIMSQKDKGKTYLEDCEGRIITNKPVFPLKVMCEVFDWGTEVNYFKRGSFVWFHSETVTIPEKSPGIRDYTFFHLLFKYKELNK